MEEIEIYLPKLGESIVEATVVNWFKKEGDFVNLDEPLLEVATDKINSEIPSPCKGRVKKIVAEKDQTIKVGEVLAILSTEEKPAISEKQERKEPSSFSEKTDASFYSPAVLQMAKENGLSLSELEKIPRKGGRLSKKDVETYLEQKEREPVKKESSSGALKMSPLRKAIAENMVRSFYEAPHASLITEIDVTFLLETIEKQKEAFFEKHKAKLSVTTFFARALCRVLQEFPHLNASLEGDTIFLKDFVNLGIAVSVEGGVIVPVIEKCSSLSLVEIAKKIYELASFAKQGKLTLEHMKKGTITLTNFGMSGTLIGIPIIHHPEVAILGMGAIRKMVKVDENNAIRIRSILHVSLTFDHRVIDGMYGCAFLKALQKELETESVSLED